MMTLRQNRKAHDTLTMKTTLKTSLYADEVVVFGRISNSQDGVVVMPHGIAPCHTAGHGNCPKVVLCYEKE